MRELKQSRTIRPYQVGSLSYKARDIGYGTEDASDLEGYFTDEMDTWGKITFWIMDAPGMRALYLFEDEITEWFPFESQVEFFGEVPLS